MKLNDWLQSKKMNTEEGAIFFGFPVQTLYAYLNGKRRPGLEKIKRINKMTEGAVGLMDW